MCYGKQSGEDVEPRLAGRYDNPIRESTISPQSGTMNLATALFRVFLGFNVRQTRFFRPMHGRQKEEVPATELSNVVYH